MAKKLNRRGFLKLSGKAGLGAAALAAIWSMPPSAPDEEVLEEVLEVETEPKEVKESILPDGYSPYFWQGGVSMRFAHTERHEW